MDLEKIVQIKKKINTGLQFFSGLKLKALAIEFRHR